MAVVDPVGLNAAAARLREALAAVTGDPVHPPLGTDPASVVAAQRLSTAATALAGGLAAQLSGLLGSAEQLGLVAAGFAATDGANAGRLATLTGGAGAPTVAGSAPPAPALPPDVRAPSAPIPATSGELISATLHAGDPAAGEGFSTSWTRVSGAAGEAAESVRSVIARLPELLRSPDAGPAVRAHLSGYATGLEAAGQRAHQLAVQAGDYAAVRTRAGRDIPTPTEFEDANRRVREIGLANLRAGGALAVPFAQAQAALRALDVTAVTNYGAYSTGADTATSQGDGPAEPVAPEPDSNASADDDSPAGTPGHRASGADPVGVAGAGPASPEGAGQLASMLPSMIPTVLGAAGGLLGGLTKVPESLLQGGMQAVQAATQGLSGLTEAKPDTSGGDTGGPDGPSTGDPGFGDAGGGGGGGTSPMAGGPMVPGATLPSTGAPPTPPSMPAGGPGGPTAPGAAGGMGGGMPIGMPMAGMGSGGGANGREGEKPREKRIVVPARPHTEAVTGKVGVDRMAVSSARSPDPDDEPQSDPRSPVVRRITVPPREARS